jgi:hypothetical protein
VINEARPRWATRSSRHQTLRRERRRSRPTARPHLPMYLCCTSQAHGRDPHRPHRPGSPDRPAGPGRVYQPGDRRPGIHQPPHRRVAPGQRVHQARHHLPQRPPLTHRPSHRATSEQPPTPAASAGRWPYWHLTPPMPVPPATNQGPAASRQISSYFAGLAPGGEAAMLTAQALDAEVSRCSSVRPRPDSDGRATGIPARRTNPVIVVSCAWLSRRAQKSTACGGSPDRRGGRASPRRCPGRCPARSQPG